MKKTIILTFSFMLVFVAMLALPSLASAAEEPEPTTEPEPTENTNDGVELDNEAPLIYGVSEYTVSNKSKLEIEDLKNSLVVFDNVDQGLAPLLFEDYYSQNWQTPGTYYVLFKAKDSSNNYGEFLVTIHVVDTSAPQFKNENGLPISSFEVYKSPNSVFILDEVMASVTVTDDIDGTIKEVRKVEDTYTGNGDKEGKYKIVLAAKDKFLNETKFTINITVTSAIPNKTVVLNKKQIIVENDVKLTNEDFSNILKVCGYYQTNTTTYINIDATSYQELSETAGDYLVGYELTTTSGTTQNGTLSVKVVDGRAGENTIISESDGLLTRIIKWIWNLFKMIADFFLGLFK